MIAFDTETVDGEPLCLQVADAKTVELVYVTRQDVLETFLQLLQARGTATALNLAWAHNLEFDLGVVFIEVPWLWKTRTGRIEASLPDGGRVELAYHHTDNPFHHLHIGSQHWLLLDTMSFLKRSLDDACKRLRLPVQKLPRPLYLGTRGPTEDERPSFEAYAKNDAQAALALAQYLVDRHQEFGLGPTVSIAQMAAAVFRTKILGQDLSHPLRTQIRILPPKLVARRPEMLRERIRVAVGMGLPFCETKPGSIGLLAASCLSFHGGKNGLYVPAGAYNDVSEVDIVSAYPHAMTALPPLTQGHWKRTRQYFPGAAAIYRVSGSVRDRCPYGVFLTVSGKNVIHEGGFDTWVTGWELAAAWGEVVVDTIMDGYVWIPSPDARNPFADYVNFFFRKKQETPKDDPRYEMYKLLMNSLYGKLIQLVDEIDSGGGNRQLVAGGLFNPFWASQITGHCRARLHTLEHRYAALHTSTDSILTRATDIATGSNLGDLEVKARGRLVILRKRLYFIVDNDGHVQKLARHGFRGRTAADLLALILRGGGAYPARHMVRPRESLRSEDKPFRMTMRDYHLRIPDNVFDLVARAWTSSQACRPIPFPPGQ
jgi:hypothetical protein